MLFGPQEVELTWEDGGIRAPVELFVQHIIMALSQDQQAQIINAVTAEIDRRNEILSVEAEIAEEWDATVGDGIEEGVA